MPVRPASRAGLVRDGRRPGSRCSCAAASLQPLGGPDGEHVDVAAGAAQQPRGDEAVAAVVALPADDRDRPAGTAGRPRARAPPPRAPSARAPGSPRSSIAQRSVARMSSRVGQRLEPARAAHRSIATAPAMPLECVSEIVHLDARARRRARRRGRRAARRRPVAAAEHLDVVPVPSRSASALATASLAQKRTARCRAGCPRSAANARSPAVKSRSASRGRRASACSRRSISSRSRPTPVTAADHSLNPADARGGSPPGRWMRMDPVRASGWPARARSPGPAPAG